MLVEHFGFGFEPDDVCLLRHVLHVVKETGRAAATADNDVLKLCHLVQHAALYLAEPILTDFGKQLGHRLAAAALYVPVKVIEAQTEFLGECPSDGRLAGTHIADENDSSHYLFTIFMHSS